MDRAQGGLEWLRRKRLDERAFLLHQLEINAALALRFPAESDSEAETPEQTAHRPASINPMVLAQGQPWPPGSS